MTLYKYKYYFNTVLKLKSYILSYNLIFTDVFSLNFYNVCANSLRRIVNCCFYERYKAINFNYCFGVLLRFTICALSGSIPGYREETITV